MLYTLGQEWYTFFCDFNKKSEVALPNIFLEIDIYFVVYFSSLGAYEMSDTII